MDNLIKSLEYFAISKNKKLFNEDIDFIISTIKLEDEDPDREWELLKSNYSKLRYIYQLLNHYHYILPDNFFNLLRIFIDSLDKTTNIYIQLLEQSDDDDDEIKYMYQEIKQLFDSSLKVENEISKINIIIKAYDLLVPIIEDFRREKYYDNLDPEFLKLYNPSSKRLKK